MCVCLALCLSNICRTRTCILYNLLDLFLHGYTNACPKYSRCYMLFKQDSLATWCGLWANQTTRPQTLQPQMLVRKPPTPKSGFYKPQPRSMTRTSHCFCGCPRRGKSLQIHNLTSLTEGHSPAATGGLGFMV